MPEPSVTRVVGYARVSTEEQSREGVSLEAQAEKLRLYCALHGLELVGVFVDAGVSAKSLNRPELAKALGHLRSRKADGLVVTKLDRLSRSVKDWNSLIDDYFGEKAGFTLMSVSDSIDTRTAAGRLVLNVLMSVAQWEREATAERTRDALRHLKAKGVRLGSSRPECRKNLDNKARESGRLKSAESKRRQAKERNADVLPRIMELAAEGRSWRLVAKQLNAEGSRTHSGAEWNPGSVFRVAKQARITVGA